MPFDVPLRDDTSRVRRMFIGLMEQVQTFPLFLLPQHPLSRVMFAATRLRWAPWKNWQINWFIRRYGVDMNIARDPDPASYPNFNQFFTRPLREDARPLIQDRDAIACPVDGVVSQVGSVVEGRLFQAKGREYGLSELLANDVKSTGLFQGGRFVTLYLAPKDYHRIHMPLTGRLVRMVYVPGRLFPVNQRTTRVVSRLFARNERVITWFETDAGPMALILIGALLVGGMETVWAGPVTPASMRRLRGWDHADGQPIVLQRGEEMGRFNMGSTVILLLGRGGVQWSQDIQPHAPVRMGQRLGTLDAAR